MKLKIFLKDRKQSKIIRYSTLSLIVVKNLDLLQKNFSD